MKLNNILDRIKKRATKKGIEYNLTPEWLTFKLSKNKCEATGLPFKFYPPITTKNPYYPSIDRVDSTKGYTTDNCQVVIFGFNVLKLNYDKETIDKFCKSYVKKYEEKLL